MRWLQSAACATVLLAITAAPARADGFITPYLGFNFGGDSANCVSLTNCEDRRLNWGVSFGSTNGIFGIEEDIGYAPDFFGRTPGADNAVLHFMTDLMVVVPAGPIQPYGLIGLGLIRSHAKFDASALDVRQNTIGYDIGGGVNVFLLRGIGIRGDVRHLHTLQDVTLGLFSNQKLDFWRGSAGLTFRF